jgi:hypothetical protein
MTGNLGVDRPYGPFFPVAWTILDGVHSYSSSVPPPNLNFYVEFATNSAAEITEWYVQVPTFNTDNPNGGSNYDEWNDILLRTFNAPTTGEPIFDESQFCSAVSCDFGRVVDYRALAFGQPGTWLITTAPPSSSVPEPSTLSLLAFGLAGLAAWGRRKFN